jgi:hypothetical protein
MNTITQGEGRERKGILFSGTFRMTTFLGEQKRWAHRVLPNEEKQVRGREVVVRHGGGNRGLPLARHGAPQDTVALANSSRICLDEHKTKGVKGGEKAFWGGQTWWKEKLAMGEERSAKGEHMVMVWWKGTECEGQGKDTSGGQYDRRKRRNNDQNKKTTCPAKNPATKTK